MQLYIFIMGASKTSIYYKNNPKARAKRLVQQTEYQSSTEQRAYRSKLTVLRRKRKLKGSKLDLSHTKSGKIVLEARSKNRARNGANGKSTKK